MLLSLAFFALSFSCPALSTSSSVSKNHQTPAHSFTIYPKSPLHFSPYDGFEPREQYYPCAPVSVRDRSRNVTYLGRRCPRQNDLETFHNIRYAAESPLIPAASVPVPGTNRSSPPSGASGASGAGAGADRPGVSVFRYENGATVDTAFPSAYCRQMPDLPWSLSYEQMRDVEEVGVCPLRQGKKGVDGADRPIPEDCLTLSVIRPADLPRDLRPLIAPEARKSTHKRGLLPVTLIIDESGPGGEYEGDEEEGDEAEDDELDAGGPGGGILKSRASKHVHLNKARLGLNAGQIVARDMAEHGLGRIIVLANYQLLDKARAHTIMQTLRQGLASTPSSSSFSSQSQSKAGTCRTPLEFERLSRHLRQQNLVSAAPIEWPIFGSARSGRQHATALRAWIEQNIETWRGDPSWLQEVVILPAGAGAMTRSTSDPDWKARRLVSEDTLKREEEELSRAREGPGEDQRFIMNMQL